MCLFYWISMVHLFFFYISLDTLESSFPSSLLSSHFLSGSLFVLWKKKIEPVEWNAHRWIAQSTFLKKKKLIPVKIKTFVTIFVFHFVCTPKMYVAHAWVYWSELWTTYPDVNAISETGVTHLAFSVTSQTSIEAVFSLKLRWFDKVCLHSTSCFPPSSSSFIFKLQEVEVERFWVFLWTPTVALSPNL